MRKIFRSVSRMVPEVLFVELDVSASGNCTLMDKLGVGPCQPEYVLFRKGKRFAGDDGSRSVDLCRMTESSLMHLVKSNFGKYLPKCEVEKVVVREFSKEPYYGVSLWDFGAPFYPNALYPYTGPYYPYMIND